MIECIKHFSAHLKDLALADRKLLGKRSVQVADTLKAQVGEVARCIAGNIVAGVAKTILINHGPARLSGFVITQAGRKLRADHVWSLVAVNQQARVVKDG